MKRVSVYFARPESASMRFDFFIHLLEPEVFLLVLFFHICLRHFCRRRRQFIWYQFAFRLALVSDHFGVVPTGVVFFEKTASLVLPRLAEQRIRILVLEQPVLQRRVVIRLYLVGFRNTSVHFQVRLLYNLPQVQGFLLVVAVLLLFYFQLMVQAFVCRSSTLLARIFLFEGIPD